MFNNTHVFSYSLCRHLPAHVFGKIMPVEPVVVDLHSEANLQSLTMGQASLGASQHHACKDKVLLDLSCKLTSQLSSIQHQIQDA